MIYYRLIPRRDRFALHFPWLIVYGRGGLTSTCTSVVRRANSLWVDYRNVDKNNSNAELLISINY